MIELRNENLRSIGSDIRLPDYDRSQLRPSIVHLGVGNFHRVHQATAIEECLCVPGNAHWAISGIGLTNGPTARQKTTAYRLQHNLYTVTELKSDLSNEPHFDDDDWRMLRSNNPTGLLGTTPFRSLDLEGCGPFKEQYLKLRHQLAADGCRAALDAIPV